MFLFLFLFVIHADHDWEINEIMPQTSRGILCKQESMRDHSLLHVVFWQHWMPPWACMIGTSCYVQLCHTPTRYRISRPIRCTFFPCILCAEGKYYFQTYEYLYIYYTTSLSW